MSSSEDGFTIDFWFVKSTLLCIPCSDPAGSLHLLTFKNVKVLGAGGFDFTHSEPAQKCLAPQHYF